MQASSYPQKDVEPLRGSVGQPTAAPAAWCDLNIYVTNALLPHQEVINNKKVVFRCDVLPHATGNKDDFEKMFELAVNLLLQPGSGTLYAYIKCEAKTTEVLDLTVPANARPFIIRFLRAVPDSRAWLQQHSAALVALAQHAAAMNIEFATMPFENEALFELTLAGKL